MQKNKNLTFQGGIPGWANACVGNNGEPGYAEYSEGFSSAANILIDQVLLGRGIKLSVDTFVYPVCFNMRHSIELRLKGAIEELSYVALAKRQALNFDLASSHDIGNIWNFFKTHSEQIDKRYTKINESINSTIQDFADIDPTGQVFRYPKNNSDNKHLTEIATISFLTLKKKFHSLTTGLTSLHHLNIWLRNEYTRGIFTEKFSRPMLYELARNLPMKSDWSNEEFTATKRALTEKYNVSNRELSKAINKIKDHYYLASLIGAPLPIKGISNDELFDFLDYWILQNTYVRNQESDEDVYSYSTVDTKQLLTEIKQRAEAFQTIWDHFSKKIRPEYLAGINTLFYFSRDTVYVEYYEQLYESELSESINYFKSHKKEVKQSFMHIFNKSNAMDGILMSLYALGHIQLAEEILGKYGEKFEPHWIEDARNRELFDYPYYAQY